MLNPAEIGRLLAIVAHPDDVDFGSAATMATLTAHGVHVTYCIVTDGDAGGSDRTVSRAEVAALRRDLSRVIREVKPKVVVGQSPERNYDRIFASHPDHLAAGEATLCAVYPDARNPFAFPELLEGGLEPWTVDEMWIAGHPAMSHALDVTEHVDTKFEALRCHASQLPDPAGMEVRVREWMRATAKAHGLADGRYAEGYRVVRFV